MTSLQLIAVSKSFGGLAALADVNLQIPAGQITGLIGPNGAGKTTVINLITGVFQLSSGRIKFGENDLSEAPRHMVALAGISRTFQTIRLLSDASVLENIMIGMYRHSSASLPAQILGLKSSRLERRRFRSEAELLLERFGMTRFASSPAGSLSYGDQRRVEIMRALALQPKILLLDEPVAGMNDVESGKLADTFQALADSGIGMLLVEHNVQFVTSLCNSIYVLDTGRLIAHGSAEYVMNDPRVISAYVGVDDRA